jgi:ketosteroid isomerase-like protein
MKRLFAIALVLMGTGSMAVAQGSVEQTLMDLERRWAKDSLANNTDGIAQLLAPDFVQVGSDGALADRASLLPNVKKMKWERLGISDMKVQVHGNTGVVISTYMAKGVGFEGLPFDVKERSVDTWVKMPDGKWRCVVSVGVTMK